jgi:hypothetical protein
MSAAFDHTTPRLVEPDTEDNLQRLFLENHWTDGLPRGEEPLGAAARAERL